MQHMDLQVRRLLPRHLAHCRPGGIGRLLALAGVSLLTAVAFSQQSAANYGQNRNGGPGGYVGGGGMGGARFGDHIQGMVSAGRGGPSTNSDILVPRRIEDDSTPGLWSAKTAILTPGDQYTLKIKVQKGDTILAGATSDSFDPALAIEDSHKKVLIKNDDRADGDQAPFIAYRFADAGDYSLKVLSYHSVAGGKFTLKMRTFKAADVTVGEGEHDGVQAVHTGQGDRVVFRLAAQKGKIYDLRPVWQRIKQLQGPPFMQPDSLIDVIGPTGVDANDFQRVETPDNSSVYTALADGDYYFEFGATPRQENAPPSFFKTTIVEVTPVPIHTSDEQTVEIKPGELKLFQFDVKPNQIVRTSYSNLAVGTMVGTPEGLKDATGAMQSQSSVTDGSQAYGNGPAWAWFRVNIDDPNDVVRLYHGAGAVRLAVRSYVGASEKLTVKNADSLPTWQDGAPISDSLNIGDAKLYLINSTNSELMRVQGEASHFQPRLEIFTLDGQLANSLCDRQTHKAKDDLYFPDPGTFLVRLSCDGNGGSGDFELDRKGLTATPYALGSAQTMNLDGNNFGLYSVDLEAGKRYQFVVDNPGAYLDVDLLDEDGQFLRSQNIVFDKVRVMYFVPTKTGRHRLWLPGGNGTWRFKLEPNTPPIIN